jgi:predicted amidohydrolase
VAAPVVAANRVGLETAPVEGAGVTGDAATSGEVGIRLYGSSSIADQTGDRSGMGRWGRSTG